jgi:putative membrane protein
MRDAKAQNRVAVALLGAYVVVFVAMGIKPYARNVWVAENLPIVFIVGLLVVLYRNGIRFSTTAYVLMACLVFLHTVGGHFTFERVPFGTVNRFFGWERNNYDRVAHATVGFYVFAIAEFVEWRGLVKNRWMAVLFGLFAIMAVAAAYEIFEWQYAVLGDPEAGIAVLGSQGDIWDAQKDMLCDTTGGILAGILYLVMNRGK